MTKLKTLLLLVLAGFILVACGSDEEAVEAEVVDPRADDKEKLKTYWKSSFDFTGDELDCAVDTMSNSLDDTNWEGLIISISDPLNPNSVDEWAAENDVNPALLLADLYKGFNKINSECDVKIL